MMMFFLEKNMKKWKIGISVMLVLCIFMLTAYLQPNALYLLDEPEVSLSPSNQVLLANEINKLARLLECQFVIATHSPFMLGTLNAKIYNIDTKEYDVVKWNELENVQYFYNFFKKHEQEFEEVIHESGE